MIRVTDLAKYKFCPYKLYLENVKRVRAEKTPKMILGILKHKISEIISKREQKLAELFKFTEVSEEEIARILSRDYLRVVKNLALKNRKTFQGYEIDFFKTMRDWKKEFEREALMRAKFLKESLRYKTIEEVYAGDVEYHISDLELGIKGRIDRIEEVDGIHIPIEIKTGSPQIFETHRLQLAGYVILCERKFSERIPYGFIHYIQSGEKIKVLIDETLRRKLFEVIYEVRKIYSGEVPEKVYEAKCDSCNLRKVCWEIG